MRQGRAVGVAQGVGGDEAPGEEALQYVKPRRLGALRVAVGAA